MRVLRGRQTVPPGGTSPELDSRMQGRAPVLARLLTAAAGFAPLLPSLSSTAAFIQARPAALQDYTAAAGMGPAAEAVAAAPHACGAPSTAAGSPSSSGGTPSASLPAGAPRPPKSAKRRAAEALLHRRFSSSPSVAALAAADATEAAKRRRGDDQQTAQPPAEQQQQQQRPPVRVAACSDCSAAEPAWCTHDVALPPLDWAAVLQSVQHEHDVPICPSTQAHCLPGARGGAGLCWTPHICMFA